MKTNEPAAMFESWWANEYGTLKEGSSDIAHAVMESHKQWAKVGFLAAVNVEPAPGQRELFP